MTKTLSISRLFNDHESKNVKVKGTGYGTPEKARKTLRLIKHKPLSYQRQVATTLKFRAKYHKYQTKNMKKSEKIFNSFLKTIKKKK